MEKCIAFLLHEGYEDLEFWVPRYLVEVAGCRVKTLGMRDGRLCEGVHGLKAPIEANVSQVLPESIDALVIPGGHAPDKLRRYNPVLRLVREINQAEKPIAMICHGPQVAISAGIVKDKRVTSSWGIRDDLVNAGAIWEEAPVVVDGNLISAQGLHALVPFCRELMRIAGCKI